jgi:hypothetical protein
MKGWPLVGVAGFEPTTFPISNRDAIPVLNFS